MVSPTVPALLNVAVIIETVSGMVEVRLAGHHAVLQHQHIHIGP
jgi:hypothetical protein